MQRIYGSSDVMGDILTVFAPKEEVFGFEPSEFYIITGVATHCEQVSLRYEWYTRFKMAGTWYVVPGTVRDDAVVMIRPKQLTSVGLLSDLM
jgi:hypothetical protein